MKRILIILTFLGFTADTFAGTCTTVTRSNAAASSVLTSALYNGDLNSIIENIWSASGALDGGCVTDGTLEDGALSTTDFAVMFNNLHQGWQCAYSDSNTITVSIGGGSIDGDFVKTTTSTTWTWGGAGDAAEASGTAFYLYGTTSSTGSTLDVVGSTSAPSGDGYSSTSKALCKFFNDGYGDIATGSIGQWAVNDFLPAKSSVVLEGYLGYGATNTKIQTFDSLREINGPFTVTQSTTNGDSITIIESGWYRLDFNGTASAANAYGISVNSSELTTNIQSILTRDIAAYTSTPGGGGVSLGRTMYLKTGDVVRAHHAGSALTDGGTFLSVTRVQ